MADEIDRTGPETDAETPAPRPVVKLDVFEGPLDLLLHLIKKSEVQISDIPISTITEQYLAYLDLMRDLNLDLAGEYLVMAATLTLIKSRMLLPEDPGGEDEEDEDPRADLVRQLLEYQRFREVAAALASRPQLGREVFAREATLDAADGAAEPAPVPLQVSVWELLDAFRRVLARARPATVHEVELEQVSLRDRVRVIVARLSVSRSLDFEALFPEEATRLELIVTFLAVLELMRLGVIRALQEERFGAIVVSLLPGEVHGAGLDLLDEYESAPAKEEG